MVCYTLLRTALDPLLAVAGPAGLARLEFLPRAWEYHTLAHAAARHQYGQDVAVKEDDGAFGRLRDELAEYFVARSQGRLDAETVRAAIHDHAQHLLHDAPLTRPGWP